MKKRLVRHVSIACRIDLIQLWTYLTDHASIDTADRIVRDIRSAFDHIAALPDVGHFRPDLTRRNVRFFLVHSHLVVYRVKRTQLHVLRVLHASRDIAAELRRD